MSDYLKLIRDFCKAYAVSKQHLRKSYEEFSKKHNSITDSEFELGLLTLNKRVALNLKKEIQDYVKLNGTESYEKFIKENQVITKSFWDACAESKRCFKDRIPPLWDTLTLIGKQEYFNTVTDPEFKVYLLAKEPLLKNTEQLDREEFISELTEEKKNTQKQSVSVQNRKKTHKEDIKQHKLPDDWSTWSLTQQEKFISELSDESLLLYILTTETHKEIQNKRRVYTSIQLACIKRLGLLGSVQPPKQTSADESTDFKQCDPYEKIFTQKKRKIHTQKQRKIRNRKRKKKKEFVWKKTQVEVPAQEVPAQEISAQEISAQRKKKFYVWKKTPVQEVQKTPVQEKAPSKYYSKLPVNWGDMNFSEKIDFVYAVQDPDFKSYLFSIDPKIKKYLERVGKNNNDVKKINMYVTLFSTPAKLPSKTKKIISDLITALNNLGRARLQYIELKDPRMIEIREVK